MKPSVIYQALAAIGALSICLFLLIVAAAAYYTLRDRIEAMLVRRRRRPMTVDRVRIGSHQVTVRDPSPDAWPQTRAALEALRDYRPEDWRS